MRAKEWFLVGIRLMGVWMLIDCAGDINYFIQLRLGLYRSATYTTNSYLAGATHYLFVGMMLLLFGRGIVNLFSWTIPDVLARECEKCGHDLPGGHDKCPEYGTPIKPAP